MTEIISIALLDFNKGQLAGLPKNPRFFRDYRYEAMKKSISDCPEMLELRELIVFPYSDGRYIVVCGNLRLRACKELGYTELPCKVLEPITSVSKLREYSAKDNISFGENDLDILQNEWDRAELQDWGIEFAPEKTEPLQMIQPFILLSPNTMKNMSSSLLYQVMRSIVIGCVKG